MSNDRLQQVYENLLNSDDAFEEWLACISSDEIADMIFVSYGRHSDPRRKLVLTFLWDCMKATKLYSEAWEAWLVKQAEAEVERGPEPELDVESQGEIT